MGIYGNEYFGEITGPVTKQKYKIIKEAIIAKTQFVLTNIQKPTKKQIPTKIDVKIEIIKIFK